MIDLWEPLEAHFLSLKHPPQILIDFFKSGESLVVVTFLHNALLLFKKPILLLQETTALFPELTEIVQSFKCKILQRQNLNFFGATTAELLRCVDDERAKILKSSFQEFYTISLEQGFLTEGHASPRGRTQIFRGARALMHLQHIFY